MITMRRKKRYSTGEAAKLLGVSFITVKRWIYAGKIKAIKTPGGHYRIPESEIQRWLGTKHPPPKQVIRKIARVLRKYGIRRAGVFGSFARGEVGPESDIDVLVDTKETNMSALQYIGMAQELEDVVGRKVDLVKYDLIRPRLRERILKEEVRIIG
jgi:hypothetical protein